MNPARGSRRATQSMLASRATRATYAIFLGLFTVRGEHASENSLVTWLCK